MAPYYLTGDMIDAASGVVVATQPPGELLLRLVLVLVCHQWIQQTSKHPGKLNRSICH